MEEAAKVQGEVIPDYLLRQQVFGVAEAVSIGEHHLGIIETSHTIRIILESFFK